MSSILEPELERTKMSPLDDIKSPNSVESELMVTDMLEDHEVHHHHHHHHHNSISIGKRKRENDEGSDELGSRKLPSLASNNNDVSFVLEEHGTEDGLHDDQDEVRFVIFNDFLLSLVNYL